MYFKFPIVNVGYLMTLNFFSLEFSAASSNKTLTKYFSCYNVNYLEILVMNLNILIFRGHIM